MRGVCLSAILVLATVASGDDKKPEPKGESVAGKISLNGKPVTAGVIVFHDKGGKLAIAAAIAKDGAYMAKVPIGEYSITILPPPQAKPKDKKPTPPLIPAKYGDPKQSLLKIEVMKGKQTFDIELKTR